MDFNALAADVMHRNLDMLKSTLADFSDVDLLVHPTPTANHAAWQLGHLAVAESRIVSAVTPGAGAAFDAEFTATFTRDTAALDDPSAFAPKATLLEAVERSRAASIAWAGSLKPNDLDQPTPERLHRLALIVGDLVHMISLHATLHIGQFQVIRRNLGKPILF